MLCFLFASLPLISSSHSFWSDLLLDFFLLFMYSHHFPLLSIIDVHRIVLNRIEWGGIFLICISSILLSFSAAFCSSSFDKQADDVNKKRLPKKRSTERFCRSGENTSISLSVSPRKNSRKNSDDSSGKRRKEHEKESTIEGGEMKRNICSL